MEPCSQCGQLTDCTITHSLHFGENYSTPVKVAVCAAHGGHRSIFADARHVASNLQEVVKVLTDA